MLTLLAVGRDDLADRQVECLGELEVALVVRGDGHDRAGAVVHEDVVGDEHGDLLAIHGVGDGAPERDARLLAVLGGAVLGRLARGLGDVLADRLLVGRAGCERVEVGVLGGEDEEGRAEEGVGAGGEDGEVDAGLLAGEDDLRALRAADPVALHRDDVVGPGLEDREVVEEPVGVVGDLEEPLLELLLLDEGAAALAMAVDDLLVGEDGGVDWAPLDGRLGAVCEVALEEAEEEPLGPAVVLRVGR